MGGRQHRRDHRARRRQKWSKDVPCSPTQVCCFHLAWEFVTSSLNHVEKTLNWRYQLSLRSKNEYGQVLVSVESIKSILKPFNMPLGTVSKILFPAVVLIFWLASEACLTASPSSFTFSFFYSASCTILTFTFASAFLSLLLYFTLSGVSGSFKDLFA